ncbi:o-succinylbenzoate--CoA ligase [Corynebacterium liangguodongii]|uniref:O-succinylbenzoate--CoA ligase n=1 Tax=Corynebacterium liangguodongii TaxID=2079535 RepID=A0A2S0WC33_9CORY|nr:o-succinylbenzoate--CoA ligase [Corynebacterium liangguodongii]AWB83318.1 o-succinylbenzoate--CoA ligase [Corynebacterium liangguodongii]PWC00592.1 o-succinylbenzoate--CoA ligase [Corynebacterium liangguodongii]
MHNLEILAVDPRDPLAILPDLEEALSGRRSLLPVPLDDPARANLLRNTMGVGEPIDEDIAAVVSTSGSTGRPKGAELTAANLVASADATHQRLGGQGQWLLAMPACYIAGLQVLVRALVAGVEPAALDLSRGFVIADFAARAREIADTGDRCYTALTPLQLAKATSSLEGIEALRLFDSVLVGGAATNPALLESARKLRINVVTTYGSSETSGGCVYDGRPIPGARVRISGGRIVLGGPMVARGYRNAPGHEAFSEPGWFATSDAGSLDGAHLTVSGRLDNVIDSGGFKLHPEVLEDAMLRVPGVTAACVVGVPDERFGQRICAAYVGSADVATLMDGLADLPRWQVPKDITLLPALPTLGPGKVDRAAVAALF